MHFKSENHFYCCHFTPPDVGAMCQVNSIKAIKRKASFCSPTDRTASRQSYFRSQIELWPLLLLLFLFLWATPDDCALFSANFAKSVKLTSRTCYGGKDHGFCSFGLLLWVTVNKQLIKFNLSTTVVSINSDMVVITTQGMRCWTVVMQ